MTVFGGGDKVASSTPLSSSRPAPFFAPEVSRPFRPLGGSFGAATPLAPCEGRNRPRLSPRTPQNPPASQTALAGGRTLAGLRLGRSPESGRPPIPAQSPGRRLAPKGAEPLAPSDPFTSVLLLSAAAASRPKGVTFLSLPPGSVLKRKSAPQSAVGDEALLLLPLRRLPAPLRFKLKMWRR